MGSLRRIPGLLPAAVLLIGLVAVPAAAATPFKVLQMNLCNSGVAGCFEGGLAVDEAVAMIGRRVPDVVSVNEVCTSDLPRLTAATGANAAYRFAFARNRSTGSDYQCTAGRGAYGSAIIVKEGVAAGGNGLYANQDGGNEVRAWACVRGAVRGFVACTTHLSTTGSVALAQCKELVPATALSFDPTGSATTRHVVVGDLNLKYSPGSSVNAQNCVPSGWFRKGDGDVQHVIARTLTFVSTEEYGMSRTDHPAFVVNYTF
ncbi:endonuclease/exonuclease/phosphatase family protein [Saccharothrix syringae]|uniref:Endonuclease/exonuclease/phosphatase family protein n=1 Tax=Saccharothrix syringae TaxID=103733 RepID=A0A5Q0GZY4_SACSY|nr:endonuclease/exonuclease/phosphatase family protein [Saccharothrix syringae]QFZ19154.1 endonuclease/exonuclease/phosphatase family protein [Saccharothrix syringae]